MSKIVGIDLGTTHSLVATSPTDEGTTKSVLAAPSGSAQFWRLMKQTSPAVRTATTRPPAPVGSFDDLLDCEP